MTRSYSLNSEQKFRVRVKLIDLALRPKWFLDQMTFTADGTAREILVLCRPSSASRKRPIRIYGYPQRTILYLCRGERKLFSNNFEIISVFYFTGNHWLMFTCEIKQ